MQWEQVSPFQVLNAVSLLTVINVFVIYHISHCNCSLLFNDIRMNYESKKHDIEPDTETSTSQQKLN